MIIKKTGKYKLLEDYTIRKSISIHRLPAGKIIEILRVDPGNKHIIGPELGDWVNWDMPVAEI